jgi:peroxiredoxin Q/BCP
MTPLAPGQPAPDFTLPDAQSRPVSLHDFRGKKVVLFFYPKDMTPTCTKESCEFRDEYSRFLDLGAAVIGISPDSPSSHRKFADKYKLPYPLLADENKEVCGLYDVWRWKKLFSYEYMGVERSTFLIDENGVLVREWRKVILKNHLNQVLDAIRNSTT